MKTKNSGALPDAVHAEAESENLCCDCGQPIEQGQLAHHPDYGAVHIACKERTVQEDAEKRQWFAELEEVSRIRWHATVALQDQLPWKLGDLLKDGVEKGFVPANDKGFVTANEYKTLEVTTGYKVASLQKFVYVARAFSPCIRLQQLSWSIHQVIAPRPTQEARKAMLDVPAHRLRKVLFLWLFSATIQAHSGCIRTSFRPVLPAFRFVPPAFGRVLQPRDLVTRPGLNGTGKRHVQAQRQKFNLIFDPLPVRGASDFAARGERQAGGDI